MLIGTHCSSFWQAWGEVVSGIRDDVICIWLIFVHIYAASYMSYRLLTEQSLLSPAAPKTRDGRYCNAPHLSTFSFHTVTQKRIDVFSRNFAGTLYVHHVMGVCCIVFDIDGMLFECCMNFLFSIFHVFFVFHAICNIKKKIWCIQNLRGGGGGLVGCWKIMFFSHFMLFPTFLGIQSNYFSFIVFFVFFYAGNIEKCPFTYSYVVKWEVVSPNSRYRAF